MRNGQTTADAMPARTAKTRERKDPKKANPAPGPIYAARA